LKETFEKVNQSNFTMPACLSLAARNLIRGLIVKDPRKRLSLGAILRHPFITGSNLAPSHESNFSINTNRLKPIRQKIKHGIIEIDFQGNVLFDHASDNTRVIVKHGGIVVTVFYSLHRLEDPLERENFEYPNLPAPLMKRYELMRKFVSLVQSKTPKVIIYTSEYKCYLMESLDFFISYQDKYKSEFDRSNNLLRIIPANEGDGVVELMNPDLKSIEGMDDPRLRIILMDFVTRYNQCIKVSSDLDVQNVPLPSFPFIIKESLKEEPKTSDRMKQTMQGTFSRLNTQNERKFLYGVGWCLGLGREHYLMLFDDGSSIELEGAPKNLLTYQPRDSFHEQYRIDNTDNLQLPQHVRLKLLNFPRFMELFNENSQRLGPPSRPFLNNFKSTLTFSGSTNLNNLNRRN
jgi:serine/threonine protein kinase